jgi:hypothetical protein
MFRSDQTITQWTEISMKGHKLNLYYQYKYIRQPIYKQILYKKYCIKSKTITGSGLKSILWPYALNNIAHV